MGALGAHLERVEAALAHELVAVDLHVADRADLARELVALAQDARGAERAPVGEAGEAQGHQFQPLEPGLDLLDTLAGLEAHAELPPNPAKACGLGQQPGEGHHDPAGLRHARRRRRAPASRRRPGGHP